MGADEIAQDTESFKSSTCSAAPSHTPCSSCVPHNVSQGAATTTASSTTTVTTTTIPAITAITSSTLFFILLWHRFETKRCADKSIWPSRQILESVGNNKNVCDDVFCNTASNIGTLRAPAFHRYGSIPRNVETQTSNSNVSSSVAPLEAVPWALLIHARVVTPPLSADDAPRLCALPNRTDQVCALRSAEVQAGMARVAPPFRLLTARIRHLQGAGSSAVRMWRKLLYDGCVFRFDDACIDRWSSSFVQRPVAFRARLLRRARRRALWRRRQRLLEDWRSCLPWSHSIHLTNSIRTRHWRRWFRRWHRRWCGQISDQHCRRNALQTSRRCHSRRMSQCRCISVRIPAPTRRSFNNLASGKRIWCLSSIVFCSTALAAGVIPLVLCSVSIPDNKFCVCVPTAVGCQVRNATTWHACEAGSTGGR